MLKNLILIVLIFNIQLLAVARTNSEIARQLYSNASRIEKNSFGKAQILRDSIASFLLDINMLNFSEANAEWNVLDSGFYYDKTSLKKINNRYIGIYKNANGNIMGSFDIYCEDLNDIQERMYGTTKLIQVSFSDYKLGNGYSLGLANKFCKNQEK